MRNRFHRWLRHRFSQPRLAAVVAALVLCVSALPPTRAGAQGPQPSADAEPAESENRDEATPIDLETLLRLPDSYRQGGERRGGIERSEWQARFLEARSDVVAKNAELERLQKKLSGLATTGGQWQAGAPGLSNTDSQHQTLSYKLRQELRDARAAITDADRGMLELGVQADLADVPDEWRQ